MLARMELRAWAEPPLFMMLLPCRSAVLLASVTLLRVVEAPPTYRPPPALCALLPLIVELTSNRFPRLWMPPPLMRAVLPLRVLAVMVALALAATRIPPPPIDPLAALFALIVLFVIDRL